MKTRLNKLTHGNKSSVSGKEASNAKRINEFRGRVNDLLSRGFRPLHAARPHVAETQTSAIDVVNTTGYHWGGDLGVSSLFNSRVRQAWSTPKDKNGRPIGNPDLGFIPWGDGFSDNSLPLRIYELDHALPYTASGLRYLVDMTVGKGPKYMYKWVSLSSSGILTEKLIPYEHAGILLRYKIGKLREAIKAEEAAEEEKNQEKTPLEKAVETALGESVRFEIPAISGRRIEMPSYARGEAYRIRVDAEEDVENEGLEQTDTNLQPEAYRRKKSADPVKNDPMLLGTDYDALGTNKDELDRCIEQYKVWERCNIEHKNFIRRNNVVEHSLKCCNDDYRLDIYFPTVGLNQGNVGEWDAKIMEIGVIPAVCARYEQMNPDTGRFEHVYYSECWKYRQYTIGPGEMVAYPVLPQGGMVGALQKYVIDHEHTPIKNRQLWFCCPTQYPSCFTPVYPQPAWWSIFYTLVYRYATTLITDKAVARNNSTMWSKMIFIDQAYLQSLYDQEGATDEQSQNEIYEAVVADINNFLLRKENHGKTLLSEKYIGADGKTEHKAFEIVDVPQTTQAATKDELEEISSIIFFALGIDPRLIGAVPGKNTSSSGTQSRELYLLKQIQCSVRQNTYLYFLNSVYAFNKMDENGTWIIEREVLTTLDASKTGITTEEK